MEAESESKNPGGKPVLEAVCDERSRRIEEAMRSLKDAVLAQGQALQAVCNDHEHRLQEHKQAIDTNTQILAGISESKRQATNKAMVYVAIIAIAVSFLSNLDKILAVFK